jgi:hypothetical protein
MWLIEAEVTTLTQSSLTQKFLFGSLILDEVTELEKVRGELGLLHLFPFAPAQLFRISGDEKDIGNKN